ncbi:MAG: hypothetical protein ACK5LO_12495 [Leucobacter sp.]
MNVLSAVVRIAEETEFDPDKVTPGVEGFFAVAVLAGAIILLGFSLVRRLRRDAYRAEIREEIAEELAQRDGGSGQGAGSTPGDPAPDAPDQRG